MQPKIQNTLASKSKNFRNLLQGIEQNFIKLFLNVEFEKYFSRKLLPLSINGTEWYSNI